MKKLVYHIVRSALISSTPLGNGENTGGATLAEPPGEMSLMRSLPDVSSSSSSRWMRTVVVARGCAGKAAS